MASELRVLAIAALDTIEGERTDTHLFSLRRKARLFAKNHNIDIDPESLNESLKTECGRLVDEGWLEYARLRYRPTHALKDYIRHKRDTLYIPDGQTALDTYKAIVYGMPPNARDAVSVQAQGRKRVTRASLGGAPSPSRSLSEDQEQEVARAVSSKRRRTRYTEPVVRLIQTNSSSRSMVHKLQKRPNRRQTLPANSTLNSIVDIRNNAAEQSTERQFKPLGQVLSERTRRAIRRNMLSEEQLALERDARSNRVKNKMELERVKSLLAESNAQLARLQAQLEAIRAAPSEIASLGMAPIYEGNELEGLTDDASPIHRRATLSPGLFATERRFLQTTPGSRRRDYKILELQKQIDVLEAAIREHELEEQQREEFDIFHDAEEGASSFAGDFSPRVHDLQESQVIEFERQDVPSPSPLRESTTSVTTRRTHSPLPESAQSYDDMSNAGEPMHLDQDNLLAEELRLVDCSMQTEDDEHYLSELRDAKSLAEEQSRELEHSEARHEAAQKAIEKLREERSALETELSTSKKDSGLLVLELRSEIEKLLDVVDDLKSEKENFAQKLCAKEEESNQSITEMRKQLKEARQEAIDAANELRQTAEDASRQIRDLEASVEELQVEKAQLAVEVDSLSAERDTACEQLDDKESELISCRTEVYELSERIDDLEQEHAKEVEKLRREYDELLHDRDSELEVLENSLREKQSSLADMESNLGEVNHEMATLRFALQKTEQELTIARGATTETTSKYNRIQEESKATLQATAIFQDLIDSYQTQLQSEFAHSTKLQQKLKDALACEKLLQSSQQAQELEASKLKRELFSERKQLSRMMDERSILEGKVQALDSERAALKQKLGDQKEELSAKLNSKEDFYKELLQSKERKLQAESDKARELESSLKEELKSAQLRLALEQEKSSGLDATNSALEEVIASLRHELSTQESQSASLRSRLESSEAQMSRLTEEKMDLERALEDLKAQIEDLNTTVADKEFAISSLEQSSDQQRATIDDLREEFKQTNETLSDTVSSLSATIEAKQKQISGLDARVQELARKLMETESDKTDIANELALVQSTTQQEIKRLKDELELSHSTASDLSISVSAVRAELSSQQSRVKTLASEKHELEEKLRRSELALVEALGDAAALEQEHSLAREKLRNELDEMKLVLRNRNTDHVSELARLRSSFAKEVAGLKKSFDETLAKNSAEHAASLEATLRSASEERQELARNHQEERLQAQAMHEEEISELTEKHEREIARVINKFKNEASQGINELMRKLGQAMLVEAKMDVSKAPARDGGATKRARIEEDETDDASTLVEGMDILTPPGSHFRFDERLDISKLKVASSRRARDSGIGVDE